MVGQPASEFMLAAHAALPASEADLLAVLHEFTDRRLSAAERCTREVGAAVAPPGDRGLAGARLHAFLRECWEALDGLGREANLCMHHAFPEAGLYPPFEMTRLCTFYTVRKKLHEHPGAADHPVTRLLWSTHEEPPQPYRRLSFLYNLSLFAPLPLLDGMLPGTDDLPGALARLVKPQSLDRRPVEQGLDEILQWLRAFAADCHERLAAALAGP